MSKPLEFGLRTFSPIRNIGLVVRLKYWHVYCLGMVAGLHALSGAAQTLEGCPEMKTILALFALMLAGNAHANVLTYSFNNVGPYTVTPGGTAFYDDFPYFNASLGTLDSVELILSGSMSNASITLYGDPSTDISDASANGWVSFSFSSTQTHPLAAFALPNPAITVAETVGPTTVYQGQDVVYSGLSGSDVWDSAIANPAADSSKIVLAAFTGSGKFEVDCAATKNIATPGLWSASITASASCDAEVIYTYSPQTAAPTVPEPASLSLLGLGLFGLAGLRRRA